MRLVFAQGLDFCSGKGQNCLTRGCGPKGIPVPNKKNIETVEELEKFLGESSVIIATSYQGIRASDITNLRRNLRQSGIEFRVAKNTLAKLAADRANRKGLHNIITGPTAFALGRGDPIEPAKVLTEFIRTSRLPITIYGGVLDGRVLSAAEVAALATIPSREVLISQLLGGLQSPMYRLAGVLNNILGSVVRVLDARRKQLEEAS